LAMRVLWLANSINLLLGPCLIFGLGPFPRLGVTGAAVATTIGRGTGVLYQLYRLTRGDARVAVRRAHLALRPAVMAMLLRLSGSGTFQVLVGTASYIGLVRIMSSFGSAALAGYTIAIRILIFALGMVLTQAFNGAGDTWTPTFINLGCFWLWEIPLAYVLARVWGLGPQGVFLAITVAYSTLALVSVVLFKRGRWKLRRV